VSQVNTGELDPEHHKVRARCHSEGIRQGCPKNLNVSGNREVSKARQSKVKAKQGKGKADRFFEDRSFSSDINKNSPRALAPEETLLGFSRN
jgi:hypothetical protein